MAVGADAGGDLRRRDGGHRGEGRDAVADQLAALDQLRERRRRRPRRPRARASRSQRVDDDEDELAACHAQAVSAGPAGPRTCARGAAAAGRAPGRRGRPAPAARPGRRRSDRPASAIAGEHGGDRERRRRALGSGPGERPATTSARRRRSANSDAHGAPTSQPGPRGVVPGLGKRPAERPAAPTTASARRERGVERLGSPARAGERRRRARRSRARGRAPGSLRRRSPCAASQGYSGPCPGGPAAPLPAVAIALRHTWAMPTPSTARSGASERAPGATPPRPTAAPTQRARPRPLRGPVRAADPGHALVGDARPDGDHRAARGDLARRRAARHLELPARDLRRADDEDRAGVVGRGAPVRADRGLRRAPATASPR